MGVVVWPMVGFEAEEALASAAVLLTSAAGQFCHHAKVQGLLGIYPFDSRQQGCCLGGLRAT